MATKTEIYELRKKEENDFYNVEDFNNNMDTLETALTEFDDTGTAEGVTSFPEMLTKLVTGNKLAVTLKNLKAGLQFVLHAGSIVNNCVTDNANLPVSAAMAKSLQDQINQANSDLTALTDIILTPANSYSFNADYTYGYKRAGWVEIQFSLVSAFDLNKDRILSIPNGCLPKKQVWFPVYESSGGNVIARGNIIGSNIYINGSNSINGKTKLFGHVVYMSES